MCKILLSINQEHVENILNGSKQYEFRTRIAKRKVDKLVIYCTSPVKRIVAEVDVLEVLSGNLDYVWDKTKELSGIDEKYYYDYFYGKKNAYAYKLGKVKKYDQPKELKTYGIKAAPQSFLYL